MRKSRARVGVRTFAGMCARACAAARAPSEFKLSVRPGEIPDFDVTEIAASTWQLGATRESRERFGLKKKKIIIFSRGARSLVTDFTLQVEGRARAWRWKENGAHAFRVAFIMQRAIQPVSIYYRGTFMVRLDSNIETRKILLLLSMRNFYAWIILIRNLVVIFKDRENKRFGKCRFLNYLYKGTI